MHSNCHLQLGFGEVFVAPTATCFGVVGRTTELVISPNGFRSIIPTLPFPFTFPEFPTLEPINAAYLSERRLPAFFGLPKKRAGGDVAVEASFLDDGV
jgi:hypothetical protein